MKRIFAVVLSAMLVLSLAACTDSTESSSQTSSGSSSVAEQSSEPDISGLTVKEEDMSNLDANSEAEPEHSESSQPEQSYSSQASSQKPEQNSSQAASQPPVEQKPTETSKPEKEEDASNLDTKVDSKPVKPAEQPSQPSTPAVPETDDTGCHTGEGGCRRRGVPQRSSGAWLDRGYQLEYRFDNWRSLGQSF